MISSLQSRTHLVSQLSAVLMIVRHGQASYTPEEDTGGDILEGTLTQEGKQQAEHAGLEIQTYMASKDLHSLHLITSPKRRCKQTAEIISTTLTNNNTDVHMATEENLRDVRVIGPQETQPGSYTRWESDMNPQEHWFLAWRRKTQEGLTFFPGEENPQDVEKRVRDFLRSYVSTMQFPTLLVTHEEICGAIADIFTIPWTPIANGEVWYLTPKM